MMVLAGSSAEAGSLFQGGIGIVRRNASERGKPEQHSAKHDCSKIEGKHGSADLRLFDMGDAGRCDGAQKLHTLERKRKSCQAPDKGEEHALSEELAYYAATA